MAALVASACGDDDTDDTAEPATTVAASTTESTPTTEATEGDSTTTAAPDEAEDWTPVTITNRLGDVVIESRPERIVALGPNDVDVVLGLGLTPVAVAANAATGGLAPWLEDTFTADGIEVLTTSPDMPLEAIAALDPDVILASPVPTIDTTYELLGEIAPVVSDTSGILSDTWQERTHKIGLALGMVDEAADLVAEGEAMLAAVAEEYPGLDGKSYSMAWARSADQIAVMAVDDLTSELFAELGLGIPDGITALSADTTGGAGTGAATLSLETVGALDADVMVVAFGDDATREAVETHAIFAAIPAVADGRYVAVDVATISAFRVPSALSIGWMFDQIASALAAANG